MQLAQERTPLDDLNRTSGSSDTPLLCRSFSTGLQKSSANANASTLRRSASTSLPNGSNLRQGGGRKSASDNSQRRPSATAQRPVSSGGRIKAKASDKGLLITPEKLLLADVGTGTAAHLRLEDSAGPAHRQPGAAVATCLSIDVSHDLQNCDPAFRELSLSSNMSTNILFNSTADDSPPSSPATAPTSSLTPSLSWQGAQLEDRPPPSPHGLIAGSNYSASGNYSADLMLDVQWAGSQDQLTVEVMHQVDPSFNRVYVPPWAMPSAPSPATRIYREAGVQTGTSAGHECLPARRNHTTADAAEHFQVFMQHFAAGLPHFGMALADLDHAPGGNDPTFVKSQYFYNLCLQLKDDMGQVAQQLQASASTAAV